MEDAAFTRDHLSTALSRLQQRLEQLRAAEEDARCRAAYEKAKAERDQLAAEPAELYPAFTDKLANLLARIDDNDREIEYVNGRLPSDASPFLLLSWSRAGSRASRRTGSAPRGSQVSCGCRPSGGAPLRRMRGHGARPSAPMP